MSRKRINVPRGIYYCFTLDCRFKISYVLKAKK